MELEDGRVLHRRRSERRTLPTDEFDLVCGGTERAPMRGLGAVAGEHVPVGEPLAQLRVRQSIERERSAPRVVTGAEPRHDRAQSLRRLLALPGEFGRELHRHGKLGVRDLLDAARGRVDERCAPGHDLRRIARTRAARAEHSECEEQATVEPDLFMEHRVLLSRKGRTSRHHRQAAGGAAGRESPLRGEPVR